MRILVDPYGLAYKRPESSPRQHLSDRRPLVKRMAWGLPLLEVHLDSAGDEAHHIDNNSGHGDINPVASRLFSLGLSPRTLAKQN